MIKIHHISAILCLLVLCSSQSFAAGTAKNLKCKGCVGASDLAKKAVTSSKIKNGAVTSAKIKDGAVNFDKLGPDVQVILDSADNSDTRITALEQGIPATNFSGYGLPFSALGAMVNVIVLRRHNDDGSTAYNIRTRYENNIDEISVQGGTITPPLIANYGWVQVDPVGDITNVNQYIEAPQTKSYNDYTAEDKKLDPEDPTSTLSLTSDNIREVWTCSGGGAISTCAVDSMIDGVSDSIFTSVSAYNALGPGTVNEMSFPDLRGENRTYSNGLQYRVRAKGIGTVLTLSSGRPTVAIYYRVNGATGGSLEDTPFEAGQPMDGIWF